MKNLLGSPTAGPTTAAGSDGNAPDLRRGLRHTAPIVAAALLCGCSAGAQLGALPSTRIPTASVAMSSERSEATSVGPDAAHNTWQLRAPMPTPRFGAAAGVVGAKAYVVGGYDGAGILGTNEEYNSATNKWETGLRAMPTPRWALAAASVGSIVYTFGGATSSSVSTNIVQAYNTTNNTWKTEAPMPTATNSNSATVYDGDIYVVGGYNSGSGRLAIIQRYDPRTNTWAAGLKPMKVVKSGLGLGTTGAEIIAAEGLADSGATTDTEGYSPASNTWSALKASPNADFNVCSGAIGSLLYVAGGTTGGAAGGPPLANLDLYDAATSAWTTGAAMPHAVILPASAALGGMLMCFGGSNSSFPGGSYYNYVQAYTP